ncbi:rhomboid family intramembrane serine protease [Actinophytocola oryzae]|uniref:Rhomboid family protein n=1 Tax=Actinophytocola oryzae TaxID=502181 RepID=A0A4R7UW04_9PSEU|nr:rhomboid family intramembrane serine protease [Actinophytocola oryzae]TDV40948.1 rhomboid family protein [Actinophytocola oryzae]
MTTRTTATAVAVATAAAVVQYTVPAAIPALQRDPTTTGEWWRLVTPLFVQTLGWYQVATNLVTLALVGAVTERLLGGVRWAVLFAAGTVGGQLAAFAMREPGGGDSIAICGLAGGLVVWLLAERADTAADVWATGVVVCYVAALTGWGLGGVRVAAVAVVAAALVVPFARRAALACAVGCALALAVAADLHGVSLLSGMALQAYRQLFQAPQQSAVPPA